jgi:hypothetical protein
MLLPTNETANRNRQRGVTHKRSDDQVIREKRNI